MLKHEWSQFHFILYIIWIFEYMMNILYIFSASMSQWCSPKLWGEPTTGNLYRTCFQMYHTKSGSFSCLRTMSFYVCSFLLSHSDKHKNEWICKVNSNLFSYVFCFFQINRILIYFHNEIKVLYWWCIIDLQMVEPLWKKNSLEFNN